MPSEALPRVASPDSWHRAKVTSGSREDKRLQHQQLQVIDAREKQQQRIVEKMGSVSALQHVHTCVAQGRGVLTECAEGKTSDCHARV